MEECSNNGEVTLFSTPKMTPSEVEIPMAVDPNLMASNEYSTWKRRPSGENVLTPRSYSDLVKNILQLVSILPHNRHKIKGCYHPLPPIMTTLTKDWVKSSAWKADLFKGKVAFITGGAGLICKVQAEALLLLGCNVAIIGRNVEKTTKAAEDLNTLNPEAKCIAISNIDVRLVASLQKAAAETVAAFGRIDFVIAGAAGNFLSDFNHLSSNAFKSVIDIDLLGSYNTVKATFPELRKSKGAIIFVSATLHYYGIPFQVHVGAAKAGVDALSNALATELGPLGIRSNCLAPGPIKGTEGVARLVKDLTKAEKRVPLQRLGTTDDVAQATVFLFSQAADYITGVVLPVDGGNWHMGHSNEGYPVSIIEKNSEIVTKL